ncbi:hypothetical protein GCM10010495_26160 [Kitasatospora herbaricolor]|uniref:DUF3574 domain-containing protein n=1 Tax=Kitasatospora herbaricolor TaxID=68217 RepID=UPI00174A6B33|nr:DUF3574 domain-containing protein [Kitasatospora herbaricolor]MDQ0311183.1 hypothetical protein [Kitasatospora herbaricolor]GGV11514.1 hypothetical protein GCM10010495_26160 [Kitasatospora herbaricolor]
MQTRIWTGLLAGAALLATGAAVAPVAGAVDVPVGPRDAYTRTELSFGTERPDGGAAVTAQEFEAFLDAEVTSRFPEGLTVEEGRGRYRDRFGAIERERSYHVVLLYPRGAARSSDLKIEEIRRRYDAAFQQEAVGRVDDSVRAAF